MKQVININFQGRVIPIESTAFEMVKSYIDSLKKHFASEESGDEIINDIEGRVGELFHEKIKSGVACITDADVDAVIASIGRPEQFDSEGQTKVAGNQSEEEVTDTVPRSKKLYRNEAEKMIGGVCSGVADYFNIDVVIVRVIALLFFGPLLLPYLILWIAVPGSSKQAMGARTKKLFRDTDEKIIAGVCSGLGKYFGVNAWIPRVIFIIPFITFPFDWSDSLILLPNLFKFTIIPGPFIIYLILWLLVPKARTAAEKLQMRGEKVDINTIRNTVIKESKSFEQKVMEAKSEKPDFIRKEKSSIGKFFIAVLKTIIYIMLGLAAFTAFIIIISLGIAAIIIFPAKDFIISNDWQNSLAWLTFILLVLVPLIAAIIWIIRRIVRTHRGSKMLRITFAGLWLLGFVSLGLLADSIAKEFNTESDSDVTLIQLANPTAQSLKIIIGPVAGDQTDTTALTGNPLNDIPLLIAGGLSYPNLNVEKWKSVNDSFHVFINTSAFGRNKTDALKNASAFRPLFASIDSSLQIDPKLLVSPKNKFRNQQISIKVFVPNGKKLIFEDEKISRLNIMRDLFHTNQKDSLHTY